MSGHSKWSQIKRQKGVTDAKRGQAFTKLGNAITIAVRQGGGITDPNSNFKLRLMMEKAREANMPKENIQRAIDRAAGKGQGAQLEEVVFEGFGPSGVGILVEAVTDNRLRTLASVKNIFDRGGGTLGSSGSVSYLFNLLGVIFLPKKQQKEMSADDLLLLAIESGAEEVEETDDGYEIYTKPNELHKVKEELLGKGLLVESAELTMKPSSLINVEAEDATKIIEFLEKLEDLDDVQKVYSNANFVAK